MKFRISLYFPVVLVAALMIAPAFAENKDLEESRRDWYNAIDTFMEAVKTAEGLDYLSKENHNLYKALDSEVKKIGSMDGNIDKSFNFFLCEAHRNVMRKYFSSDYSLTKLGGICASIVNNSPSQNKTETSANWKFFDKINNSEYFIDTNSIRQGNGLTFVWEKIEANIIDQNNPKKRQTVLIFTIINCKDRTLAGSSMTVIDKNENGDVTNTQTVDNDKPKFHPAVLDTPGDKLVSLACAANGGGATSGLNSSGSGFFVSPNGYLLTNNHVVNGCPNLKIRDSSKNEYVAAIVATDPRNDLALLKISANRSLPAATFRGNNSVDSGENAIVLGYPLAGVLASEVNVSFGYVSAMAGLADDTSKMQISAPVQPGNSGGPLLDQAGNIIGVVVAKLDAIKVAKAIGDIPQNINFAVKGEVAQTFLNAHKVKFKTTTTAKKLENTDIASRGREFTVLVECYR